jgi:hypothetical protein
MTIIKKSLYKFWLQSLKERIYINFYYFMLYQIIFINNLNEYQYETFNFLPFHSMFLNFKSSLLEVDAFLF